MITEVITTKKLSDLKTSEQGIITRVAGHGAFRKRITEMGFIKGKKVTVIKNAPLRDPIEYSIMDYHVSLRRSEAGLIDVLIETVPDTIDAPLYYGTRSASPQPGHLSRGNTNTINVALVGNPNSGKTTIFNYASGAHERVGNYGGVTVDAKEAMLVKGNSAIALTDLPGTYSITEYTPEELYVRAHIINNAPDVVVNVVDASNLERNLFLTTQLIDMQVKVILALNMHDEFLKTGASLNHKLLSNLLGIPIVPTVGSKGIGIDELVQTIIDVHANKNPVQRFININYGDEIEFSINRLRLLLEADQPEQKKLPSRYLAVKLLENDSSAAKDIQSLMNSGLLLKTAGEEIQRLELIYKERSATIITDAKYGFIAGALGETLKPAPGNSVRTGFNIDRLLTHRFLGFPVFLLFMWLMFQATFTIGSYPMHLIENGISLGGEFTGSLLTEGPLRDLLIDGIIGGVGGVVIFLPNILLLFFFISLMEDTGYMARAAFIMDKLMHKIGLHGKSFIPLLMGFGCNVPAIMATRTLENRKDRILTMLITPFMSCSARLPVYVLIISATFAAYQGLVLLGIYLAGILIAIIVALVMKKIAFAKEDVPFVMELPPYRVPTLRNTTRHMWFKAVQYLNKMGSVILLASILIWALGYFPRTADYSQNYTSMINTINANPLLSAAEKSEKVNKLEVKKEAERQQNSYIGRLGRFIEPAIAPLGFDWKIGVSIITGLAAKEIVVSSMGVLYQAGLKEDENSASLKDKIVQQTYTEGPNAGKKVFTPLVAIGFMLFVLIYFPCVAVIAAVRKESNWKWAVFSMIYTTGIAYLAAFLTYQIGSAIL